MPKFVRLPSPKRELTAKAHLAPAARLQRVTRAQAAPDTEEIAADRMAVVMMRRAYGAGRPAPTASRTPAHDPVHNPKGVGAGRIRRAVAPGIQAESLEVATEVASRLRQSLAWTGPMPIVEGAEQESESESEEVGADELLDPSVVKVRAMYGRLLEAGVQKTEIHDVLEMYAAHLAKGGSDDDFIHWIRSSYLTKGAVKRSSGSGRKPSKGPKPTSKPDAKAGGKAAGKASAKSGAKAGAKTGGKTGTQSGGKAKPAGKPKARTGK